MKYIPFVILIQLRLLPPKTRDEKYESMSKNEYFRVYYTHS